MQTVYDWLTLACFSGLVVLFLQRSTDGGKDKMLNYLPPALGCAVANYLGNEHYDIAAVAVLAAAIAYVFVILKPFQRL